MRSPSLESEFLPALLEIRETAPSPAGRALLWALLGLLATAVAWAASSSVDIVAVAPGRILPSGHSKTVQALETGRVAAIRVGDGDAVEAGQVLVELDASSVTADIRRATTELEAAQAEDRRLRELVRLLESPGEPGGSLSADGLLLARWQAYQGQVAALAVEARRREAEGEAAEAEVARLRARLPFAERKARDLAALAAQKLAAEHQQRDAELERQDTALALETQRRRVAATVAAQREAEAQAARARTDMLREVAERLDANAQRVVALREELVKARSSLGHHTLTAPVDGVVQQLTVHTVGGVVTPAQPVLVVVPRDAPLEVEALVANKDVGFVREGQPAEVKVDAYPFTEHGTVAGELLAVSRDGVPDERLGIAFKARVRLDASALARGGRTLPLGPGMSVQVEIRTGSRKLIEFFLSPLLRYVSEAARER